MIAHCLPNAIGDSQNVRAWQMLKIACKTHRVSLLCIDNSSIHISLWRTIKQMTEKLVVEKTNFSANIFSIAMKIVNAPSAERNRLAATLKQLIESLNNEQPFDTLLCTHPALLSDQAKKLAGNIICDLANPKSIEHMFKSHTASALTQWWHKKQSKHHLEEETLVATYSDIITLADDDHWQKINEHDCHTLVIPQHIESQESQESSFLPPPNIVVKPIQPLAKAA